MRDFFFVVLLGAILGANATSQQSTPSVPTSTTATAAAKTEKSHDYLQESFVVEQIRTRYRFETDGTGRKEVTARIRVQSEAGVQQWGQIQ